jgi:hypothetical protein
MINIEMSARTAAAVLQVLSKEQERYTTDGFCVPERITDIRGVMVSISEQIEAELKNETTDT